PAMLAAWLGAILAGKWPTFLSYPSRKVSADDYRIRLENYRRRFGSRHFVGEESERELVTDLVTTSDLPRQGLDPGEAISRLQERDESSPLFLQCSSGTTGLQKAVAIPATALMAQITGCRQAIGLDPERDRIVSWLPLYHDMGLVATFLLPLLTRTPVCYLDPFAWAAEPASLLRAIERHRGSLCWLPNFAFAFLARVEGTFDLTSMRAFINCSEPASPEAFHRFRQRHGVAPGQLAVSYALAENVFAATQTPPGAPPRILRIERDPFRRRRLAPHAWEAMVDPPPESDPLREGTSLQVGTSPRDGEKTLALLSCGRPLPGVEVRIAGHPGEEIGELLLAGSCAIPRYFRGEPAREDGWVATGDLGFLHEGELFLCGRKKDLIIHRGRNLYPQDLEALVNEIPGIHPGRAVALGRAEAEYGSEEVLILAEPEPEPGQAPSLAMRQALANEIKRRVDPAFDLVCEVALAPPGWLLKSSSGKIARGTNLDRFLASRQRTIHLCGDSHVRLFWTDNTSHSNRFRGVRAHWVGLLWSENWRGALPYLAQLAESLAPRDLLVIQAGEPECRSIFAVDPDPEGRIERAVAEYQAFFTLLSRLLPHRLAYMTGIPTQPDNLDNGDRNWPVRGSREERYRWQKLFYARMRAMCTSLVIHFIDVCQPLLEADGFIARRRLADCNHLHPDEVALPIQALEAAFGPIDLTPTPTAIAPGAWDGTREHFETLLGARIRELVPFGLEIDENRLVSGGFLDSLAIVGLIATLDRLFGFQVSLERVDRLDFDSVARIWEVHGPGNRTVATGSRPVSTG
ncbi:MAG: AMP-binding protein, partial [Magnetococcales bacterium]|nr:AMP-binding protein [Magnetococcales bacterium]